MKRLYLRIYLAVLASLFVFALLIGSVWYLAQRGADRPSWGVQGGALVAQVVAELLPADATPETIARSLQRWHERTGASLALLDRDGGLLASVGEGLPASPQALARAGWQRGADHAPVYVSDLPDGRRLVAARVQASGPFGRPPRLGFVSVLLLVGAAIGVGAYPVVRRLTRRLEDLQGAVERFGRGDLGARAPIDGRDEVAVLAERFNRSAERIEALLAAQRALLDAHKRLLANASHELRSPLARIRMAVELIGPSATAELSEELVRNVAELDQLVDEILLASRLDAAGVPLQPGDVDAAGGLGAPGNADALGNPGAAGAEGAEGAAGAAGGRVTGATPVDLTALVAEACARDGVPLEASACMVEGDARLLARLVRNLLENAQRHAAGAGVRARLSPRDAAQVCLQVCDRGPGVPEAERERIFEPFYRAAGASERAGGVGLGLSLVRQIARLHGGRVTCLPGPDGQGSCFEVVLPVGGARP
ncbi:MAG TPA: HAMP domain-containing sensor histidine kinase [Quisquiliibacterium sp.]|nr:HAMP domain-containing sensor histidine kinase [Quisquiliibacterium sp.]HQN12037.1 HAMP domain-containing sensor histidine kinase [Quisquiliibacterium sp.]